MALGKGLGEILEEVGLAYENELEESGRLTSEDLSERVQEIDIQFVEPNPYQPRKNFDSERLAELSESIKEHGLLQPVVVVAHKDRYILVAGERRLRAHKLAKLKTIRAIVADVSFDDLRMRELALVENIQRENLNAIELANSYQELLDVHKITHEELSRIVHKSRSQITNTIRLLVLSDYAQEMIIKDKITQGHAKVLVGLDEKKAKVFVDTIIGQKLNVRETENLLKRKKSSSSAQKKSKTSSFDPELIKKLAKNLPLSYTLKEKKIEIVLPNEDALIQFITLIEKN
jgi:ParB family chromosome partitioning protein